MNNRITEERKIITRQQSFSGLEWLRILIRTRRRRDGDDDDIKKRGGERFFQSNNNYCFKKESKGFYLILLLVIILNCISNKLIVVNSSALVKQASLPQAPHSITSNLHNQQVFSTATPSSTPIERCTNGPPLQWRPHLDVASKAHLAPIVALASLDRISIVPIQLGNNQMVSLNSLQQHINNVGVNIEAFFKIATILKKTIQTNPNLKVKQTIKLVYRVSASLSTTSALMTLINSNSNNNSTNNNNANGEQTNNSQQQGLNSVEYQHNKQLQLQQLRKQNLEAQQKSQSSSLISSPLISQQVPCALDLSEDELVKKVDKIFKMNQNYILFLDQMHSKLQPFQPQHFIQPLFSSSQQQPQPTTYYSQSDLQHQHHNLHLLNHHHQFNNNFMNRPQVGAPVSAAAAAGVSPAMATNQRQWQQQQQQQQQIATNMPDLNHLLIYQPHPFASHELLTNQTGRILRKILYKNLAQVPQVQLVNSTVVPVQASEQQQQLVLRPTGTNKIRLVCSVSGFPTPWVQWYRNGQLLRNKPGKISIKTSKWNKSNNNTKSPANNFNNVDSSQVRLSKLELELQAGKNETGIYECRAMNVVAREPVVGTYTLLVKPTHYAVIPILAAAAGPNHQLAHTQQQPPTPPPTFSASTTTTASPSPSTSPTLAQPSTAPAPATTTTSPPPPPLPSTSTSPSAATTTTSSSASSSSASSTAAPAAATTTTISTFASTSAPTSPSPALVVTSNEMPSKSGQPCPKEANENYCLNKGTCVLIGHIEEFLCNCAEGYHGHRCEYKSLEHQQA